MSPTYCYLHLRGPGPDRTALSQALTERILGAWRQDAITVWGVWEGIFGVGSNELIVVAAAPDEQEAAFTAPLTEIDIVDVLALKATVRPPGTGPCDRPGLYVFRFFEVREADVDQVVTLSSEAWETFENTDAYAAEPKGLFRQARPVAEGGRMLLVTWYDGLASWQASRRPAPAAVANFQRRRALTGGTVALATRLLTPFP